MRPALLSALICLVLVGAGCASFPEVDAAVSEEAKVADRPNLADNRILLAKAGGTALDIETQEAMKARADALGGRVAEMDGPVIPPDEAQRITDAARRLAEEAARVAPEG